MRHRIQKPKFTVQHPDYTLELHQDLPVMRTGPGGEFLRDHEPKAGDGGTVALSILLLVVFALGVVAGAKFF